MICAPGKVCDYCNNLSYQRTAVRKINQEALLTAGAYFIAGCAWIFLSDKLVESVSDGDDRLFHHLQTYKGWFFILVTTVALYFGLAYLLHRREESEAERRRLEDMLSSTRKLEALGTLAGVVAHDFNNIISVIGLRAQLASTEDDSTVLKRHLVEIEAASAKATQTVQQLMLFIRKGPAVDLQPMDLTMVVQRADTLLRETIVKGVSVVIQAAPDLPKVRGDAALIEQALANLLTNARDAVEKAAQPRISVRLHAVRLRHHRSPLLPTTKSGHYVALEVSDNGPGIPLKDQTAIFAPLFTTKPAGKGTGLGLSSVWRIMEQHGGWVEVISEPGHGARFSLYFPVDGAL